jgi:hypothetical protein
VRQRQPTAFISARAGAGGSWSTRVGVSITDIGSIVPNREKGTPNSQIICGGTGGLVLGQTRVKPDYLWLISSIPPLLLPRGRSSLSRSSSSSIILRKRVIGTPVTRTVTPFNRCLGQTWWLPVCRCHSSSTDAKAPPRFPSPFIKPDVRVGSNAGLLLCQWTIGGVSGK